MNITKAGSAQGGAVTPEELEAINAFAKTPLEAGDVYCFSVLLCDNEVDRDFERFTEKTLSELRELFTGRTGITDHNWSADAQKARIYRCELVTDAARKTSLGAPYMYLRGRAYMLRSEGNAELIAEIDGGIKRETSVGCSVARTLCSICGQELGSGTCSHIKGRTYDGKLCCGELDGAVDAYEWSFVAVPSQRGAGVMKKLTPEDAELRRLIERAELGERYLAELRTEVLRLGLICSRDMGAALEKSLARMESGDLLALRSALEAQAAEKLPIATQLPGRNELTKFSGDEYRI